MASVVEVDVVDPVAIVRVAIVVVIRASLARRVVLLASSHLRSVVGSAVAVALLLPRKTDRVPPRQLKKFRRLSPCRSGDGHLESSSSSAGRECYYDRSTGFSQAS
jgi:hypothetical protein